MLISSQRSQPPIRTHIRKSLLANINFRMLYINSAAISLPVTGHNGHKPKRPQPKRPQTGKATDRNGHKPKRPQTETATDWNGQTKWHTNIL